jgi:ribosome-associated protein
VDLLADKMGEDIILLDIREQTIIADFFVICSGTSERQTRAMIDGIAQEMKQQHGIIPLHVESDAGNGWVLIDYGAIMVHIFSPEARAYYDLENFWNEANVLLKMQ